MIHVFEKHSSQLITQTVLRHGVILIYNTDINLAFVDLEPKALMFPSRNERQPPEFGSGL